MNSDHWQIGTEIDYVSARFDFGGVFGIIKGGNLSGKTGYVWQLAVLDSLRLPGSLCCRKFVAEFL